MWINILAGHLKIDYPSGPIFTLHHWVQSRFQEDPDSLNRNLCASRICAIPAIFLTGITAHHHSQGFVLCTSHSSHGQLSHLPVPHHDLLKKPGWQITSPFCPFKALGIEPSDLSLQICFRAQARTTGQDNLGKSGDGNGRFIVQVTPTAKCSLGFGHHFHYEKKWYPLLSPRLLPQRLDWAT